MSYAIMRMEKKKSSQIKSMENHNERNYDNHSNLDIDKDKEHLNYDIISCDNYKKKIDEEIKKRYTKDVAIRKDAVFATEFIFTSDEKFFADLTPEDEKKFFEESVEFLKKKFGAENIISAKVHKDETTPHMHVVIVPLHEDGSLSMNKFIDGKKDLANLQDDYFSHISKEFSTLERGKASNETKRKHISLSEYKKQSLDLEIATEKLKIAEFKNSLMGAEKENVKIWLYDEISKGKYSKILKDMKELDDIIKKRTLENVVKMIKKDDLLYDLKEKLKDYEKALDKFHIKNPIEQTIKNKEEQMQVIIAALEQKKENKKEKTKEKGIER